jgi:hypothetical protein
VSDADGVAVPKLTVYVPGEPLMFTGQLALKSICEALTETGAKPPVPQAANTEEIS